MPARDIRPRTECRVCGREVAVTRAATLYPHKDREAGKPCPGSGGWAYPDPDPSDDPADNGSIGLSGGTWGPPEPEPELAQWWRDLAEEEVVRVVDKAVEYGATDLRDLGYQVLEMAGRRASGDRVDIVDEDRYATEVGIAFYAMGKMARIAAAIKEGRQPSSDSWHDLGVYARMAQRVHQVGGWPGVRLQPRVKRFTVQVPAEEVERLKQEYGSGIDWDKINDEIGQAAARLRGL